MVPFPPVLSAGGHTGTGNGQEDTKVSTWAGHFTGPHTGRCAVVSSPISGRTHHRASPLTAALVVAALVSSPSCPAKYCLLRGMQESYSSPYSSDFCCLFASESSKRLLNKLHFIWDAITRLSQAVMMPLPTARAAGHEPEQLPWGTPITQPTGLQPLFTQSHHEGRGMAVTDCTDSLA